uniref:Integrase, catalytic region, zinc finger, CCHC-type, peptidase aspartic, catalytic n=1 Tax=Tanacetum cinerariifolium TaxID=118510 RepID=A0A6L2JA06_TANCI|nr:hypothetical protein [Tanacetum cinerariifolium]
MYGKIWNNEDVHDLESVETEFPTIVFNDTSDEAPLSYEPTVNLDNSTSNVLIPSDSWTSELLVYKEPLSRLDRLRESRAQILWGMYNKKNIDYVALLWEYFMYQADNKEISSARKEHMLYTVIDSPYLEV